MKNENTFTGVRSGLVARSILQALLLLLASNSSPFARVDEHGRRPNIIVILADDQGYGDVRALNPACGVATPNMDRLCDEGAIFREAYSASAYRTPSRYSLLTGRYTWRTNVKVGFPQDPLNFAPGSVPKPLPPYPALDRPTIPKMLEQLGYRNAVVGKWHLVTPPEQLNFHYSFLQDGYFVKTKRFRENGVDFDYTEQLHYPPSLQPGTTYAEMIEAGNSLTNEGVSTQVCNRQRMSGSLGCLDGRNSAREEYGELTEDGVPVLHAARPLLLEAAQG